LRSNFDPINKVPVNALKLGLPLLSKQLSAVTAINAALANQGIQLATVANPPYQASLARAERLRERWPNRSGISAVWDHQQPAEARGRLLQRRQVDVTGASRRASGWTFIRLREVDHGRRRNIFGDSPLNGVIQNPSTALPCVRFHSIPPHVLFGSSLTHQVAFGKGKSQ
jgi:hypothetical protein